MIISLVSAFTIGLGCGSCCSPFISLFLSSYVISHCKSIKRGILSFAGFLTGKISGIVLLCVLSSILGRQIVNTEGFMGDINLRLISQLIMSFTGIVMLIKWIKEYRGLNKNKCADCSHHVNNKYNKRIMPIYITGFAYGITPCTPLIIIIGYSFSLSVLNALLIGISFGIASILSPVIMLAIISGVFSKRITKEIPEYIRWFRLASYMVLIIMPFVIPIK